MPKRWLPYHCAMESQGIPRMNLRALRYFVAIAEAGSLTAAAAAVAVAQPA